MPRTSGIYSLPPGYHAVAGETIQPSQHNPPLEDIAQALTDSLPRDGSAGMTGNLPMGGQRITGLGAATAAAHAPRFDQVVKLDGTSTMTGPLAIPVGTEAAPGAQWGNANNGVYWTAGQGPSFTAAGSTIGQLRSGTALAEVYSIVTRQAGDVRYLRQTGGTLTGALTVNGATTVNGNMSVTGTLNAGTTGNNFLIGHGGSNAYLDNGGTGALQFRQNGNTIADFQNDGALTLRRAGNGLLNWSNGDLFLQKGTTNVGKLDNDGGLGSAISLVTRGAGDSRYTSKSWSVSSGAGLTGGGDGNSNRTISMGTPSDITRTSGNSASGNTHTHRITDSAFQDMLANMITHVSLGVFVFARQFSGTSAFGQTTSGSNLRVFAVTSGSEDEGTSLTGTWRCHGAGGNGRGTVWQRIA